MNSKDYCLQFDLESSVPRVNVFIGDQFCKSSKVAVTSYSDAKKVLETNCKNRDEKGKDKKIDKKCEAMVKDVIKKFLESGIRAALLRNLSKEQVDFLRRFEADAKEDQSKSSGALSSLMAAVL